MAKKDKKSGAFKKRLIAMCFASGRCTKGKNGKIKGLNKGSVSTMAKALTGDKSSQIRVKNDSKNFKKLKKLKEGKGLLNRRKIKKTEKRIKISENGISLKAKTPTLTKKAVSKFNTVNGKQLTKRESQKVAKYLDSEIKRKFGSKSDFEKTLKDSKRFKTNNSRLFNDARQMERTLNELKSKTLK